MVLAILPSGVLLPHSQQTWAVVIQEPIPMETLTDHRMPLTLLLIMLETGFL